MRVQITTRVDAVPQDARDRATDLMGKLQKFEPSLLSADLVFSEDGPRKKVEGVLSIAGADRAVASGEGNTFVSAADDLSAKLSKMLRRRRSQARDRRVRAPAGEQLES